MACSPTQLSLGIERHYRIGSTSLERNLVLCPIVELFSETHAWPFVGRVRAFHDLLSWFTRRGQVLSTEHEISIYGTKSALPHAPPAPDKAQGEPPFPWCFVRSLSIRSCKAIEIV